MRKKFCWCHGERELRILYRDDSFDYFIRESKRSPGGEVILRGLWPLDSCLSIRLILFPFPSPHNWHIVSKINLRFVFQSPSCQQALVNSTPIPNGIPGRRSAGRRRHLHKRIIIRRRGPSTTSPRIQTQH